MGVDGVRALGVYFRQQRESWGLTQEALADKTGLDQRKIHRIERGVLEDPGFLDIATLALWFGVTMETVAKVAGLIDERGQLVVQPNIDAGMLYGSESAGWGPI